MGLRLGDHRLSGALNLSTLAPLRHLTQLDLSSNPGLGEADTTLAIPPAIEADGFLPHLREIEAAARPTRTYPKR